MADSDLKEYFQMANEQLKKQFETIDALNTKVSTMLIMCSIFTVFLGGLIFEHSYWAVVGFTFIIIAIGFLLYSYRVVDWQNSPNIERINYNLEKGTKLLDFYKEVIEKIDECYTKNETALKNKSSKINIASLLLAIGLILSIIGFISYLL